VKTNIMEQKQLLCDEGGGGGVMVKDNHRLCVLHSVQENK
jgi:hypothetical protein